MHFVTESVPGEITLMFISYLMFCTVLMYLFVKADSEWGRMEVSLDDVKVGPQAALASAMLFSSAEPEAEQMFAGAAAQQSVNHCTQHHELDCVCFMQPQRKSGD